MARATQAVRTVARDQDDIEPQVGEDTKDGVHAHAAIAPLKACERAQSEPKPLGGLGLSADATRALRPDNISEIRERHDADAADVRVGGWCWQVLEIRRWPSWHSLYLGD